MNLRPKAKRRIAFLAVVFLAVVTAGAVALRLASRNAARRLEAERADAMAAYQAGDYAGALDHLAHYLEKAKDDLGSTPQYFRAMLAYGKCRMNVRTSRGDYLVEAKTIFQNYLSLCPDDLDAQHALLTLYPQIDYQQEELALADTVLAAHPDDAPALTARAQALLNQTRPAYADALKTCDHLNDKCPLDLHGQLLGMEIRLRMHAPPPDLIARAQSLQKSHEGDPRFELVLGATYLGLSRSRSAGEQGAILPATAPTTRPILPSGSPATRPAAVPLVAQADAQTPSTPLDVRSEWAARGRRLLEAAAARPAPDADFVRWFVATLDGNEMFPRSVLLLQKDAPALNDPALNSMLVQRLWENGFDEDVIDATASLDPMRPGADVTSLALRASALDEQAERHQQRPVAGADAAAILQALSDRKADPAAAAWVTLLTAHYSSPAIDPRELIKQYQSAIEQDPLNAVPYLLSGDAYAALGEVEAAASQWESACWHAPEWGLPFARIARLRLLQGRSEEAFARAQAAVLRLPQSPEAQATAALAWAARLKGTTRDGENAHAWALLLQDVQAIQKQWPRERETLPLYVTLLAESGRRSDALAVLSSAAAANPPPSTETLLALDEVNKAEALGFGPGLVNRARAADANSIPLAMRRAVDLLRSGDPAAGIEALQQAQTNAKGENDPRWRLAVATYLERAKDPKALPAWVQLADSNPADRSIQSAALQSTTRFLDRDFWKRSIERLHDLTGESGQMWRLEHSRWLLAGLASGASADPEQAEKDRSEAVTILTELTRQFPSESEPHRLLGLAFERDRKLDRAADELGIAISLQPADVESTLDLVRILTESGKRADAQAAVDRISRRPALSPESRRLLALACEQLGRPQRAIELLTAGPPAAAPTPGVPANADDRAAAAAWNGILARLYSRTGRYDQAEALYASLLDLPSASPQELAEGSEFFAGQGKPQRAKEFLARLAGMNLAPEALSIINGRFQEVYGSPDLASKAFVQATLDASASPKVWYELACFHLRRGSLPDAAAAVEAGLKAAAGDPTLLALNQDIALLRTYRKPVEARLLTLALTRDPSDVAAIDLLKAMLESQENNDSPARKLERLKAVLQRYPGFLPAQDRLIAAYLDLRQFNDAAEIAGAAMQANPYDPDAARLATGVYLAAGQKPQALDAAAAWRQRSGGDTLRADLAVADTLISLDRAREAVDCLAPYIKLSPPTLPSSPDAGDTIANLALYRGYAHALIAAGRAADAAVLLRPLLSNADARFTWMSLATQHKTPEAAAAWLDQVTPFTGDSAAERYLLADAWHAAGSNFNNVAALEKARDLLAPMAGRSDADPRVLALHAQVAQELGDYDTAETTWRRLIQDASAQAGTTGPVGTTAAPEIRNNLAYLLMIRGDDGNLTEARQLAEQAVAASPDTSTFYDTLARICSRQGNRDLAIKTFRTARGKDPDNVEALIGLADELSHGPAPDAQAAKELLVEINRLIEKGPAISGPLQVELKSLRQRAAIETDEGR